MYGSPLGYPLQTNQYNPYMFGAGLAGQASMAGAPQAGFQKTGNPIVDALGALCCAAEQIGNTAQSMIMMNRGAYGGFNPYSSPYGALGGISAYQSTFGGINGGYTNTYSGLNSGWPNAGASSFT